MRYSSISKSNIKLYIKDCKKELVELEKEINRKKRINRKVNEEIYDLAENYLKEENLKGQIKAAKYILYWC